MIDKSMIRAVRRAGYQLIGNRRRADLLLARSVPGWFTTSQMELAYDTVRGLEGPGALAEVGCWKGRSACTIGLALKRAGRGEKLYAIDHHEGSEEHRHIIEAEGSTWGPFTANLRRVGVEEQVEPLRMDSQAGARWLTEREIRLKFLHVDAAHDEESVVRDVRAFLPLLLPGAYVAMDDAIPEGKHPGVYKAYERVLEPLSELVAWGRSLLLVRMKSSA